MQNTVADTAKHTARIQAQASTPVGPLVSSVLPRRLASVSPSPSSPHATSRAHTSTLLSRPVPPYCVSSFLLFLKCSSPVLHIVIYLLLGCLEILLYCVCMCVCVWGGGVDRNVIASAPQPCSNTTSTLPHCALTYSPTVHRLPSPSTDQTPCPRKRSPRTCSPRPLAPPWPVSVGCRFS